MAKLGDTVRIDLGTVVPELKDRGVFLVYKHMGPGWVRQHAVQFNRIKQREMQRLVELRKNMPQAEAPELYMKNEAGAAAYQTADYYADLDAFALSIVSDCAHALQADPRLGLPEDPIEAVKYLGCATLLMDKIMEGQKLTPEQVF